MGRGGATKVPEDPPGHAPFSRLPTAWARGKNLDAQATKFKSQPRPMGHTARGGPLLALLAGDLAGRSADSQGRSLERPERPGSRPSGPDLYSRRQSETASRNNAAPARASYSLWSRSWSSTLRCREIPGSRLVRKGPLAGEESSERPGVGPGQGLGRWPVCGAQGWTRRRTLEREGAPSE